MSEKQTETMEEKRRIRRANIVLEEIDRILDSMIDSIVNQKNEIDGNSIGDTTFDANATEKFISKINSKSLEINGDEKMLIAINKRYDDAINMLKKAMKEENKIYKEQFKNELDRVLANKSERYDTIAETYKEVVSRLEKGETQRDYFQDKADKKQAEIDINKEKYDSKIKNADIITIEIEKEKEELAQKEEVKRNYENLLKLNKEIEDIENKLKQPDLEEEKKEKLEEKLEEMKEKRKEAVERFSKEATNKDGKKYAKAEGKSDKEYIDELDSVMIDEAVLSAVNKFNNKLANMDPTKSKITLLGKDFKENGELDVSREVINDYKSAEELLNKIALQKRLWETKKKRDGFDERKIDAEREEFQNKADSYIDLSEKINDSVDERQYPVAVQKFDWRHPIKSIKSLFQKRKNNAIKTKMSSDFDINTTKKEALKYIEKNRKELENISATDKKKQKFHDGLEYNVSVSEEAIKKFWDSNDRENVETEDRDK